MNAGKLNCLHFFFQLKKVKKLPKIGLWRKFPHLKDDWGYMKDGEQADHI